MILVDVRTDARFRGTPDPEALIKEARRRQRRRWLVTGCVALLIASTVCLATRLAEGVGASARQASSLTSTLGSSRDSRPLAGVFSYPLAIADLEGVSCSSSSTCEAVGRTIGSSVALRTTDAGRNWTRGLLPIGASAVACPSSSMCLVAGTASTRPLPPGAIAVTNDAGGSWSSVALGSASTTLSNIACPSTTVCEVTGQGPGRAVAFRTANGGATWTAESLPETDGDVDGLSCPSVSACYVLFNSNDVYSAFVTTDGGGRWRTSVLSRPATGVHQISGISCPSVSTCVTAGDSEGPGDGRGDFGFTFKTTDGGRSWLGSTVRNYRGTPSAIGCVSSSVCEMVGYSRLNEGGIAVRTTDGGAEWRRTLFPYPVGELMGVACATASSCVAIASLQSYGAAVVDTANGGTSWVTGGLPGGIGQPTDVSCATTTSCARSSATASPSQAPWRSRAPTRGGHFPRSKRLPSSPTSPGYRARRRRAATRSARARERDGASPSFASSTGD